MDYETFLLIAKTARELRTEAATYALLDAYARNQCATYPVDSALFMELWPDGQVPGFVLTPYLHIHPATHTVAFALALDASDTHTPQRADARLIAAAPDLLAALGNLLDFATGVWEPEGADLRAYGIEPAHAAIAKAEGGAE